MITLGKTRVKVPPLHAAGTNMLQPKSLYVLEDVDGTPTPQLADGHKAVLARGAATAELTTRSSMGGGVTQRGTYLTEADVGALGGSGDLTVRKYRWTDTWAKIWSRGGRRFLLATFVAVASSLVGAWFLFEGEKGTSAGAAAAQAQSVLEWATTPADGLEAGGDVAGIRRQLARREREASRCLAQLKGEDVPKANVDGVATCAASTPAWIYDKQNEALITTLLSLIIVLLTVTGLRDKFAFGKDPGEA